MLLAFSLSLTSWPTPSGDDTCGGGGEVSEGFRRMPFAGVLKRWSGTATEKRDR